MIDHNWHSRATSLGMRRWWAAQPSCMSCKKVKIRNVCTSLLCAKCRRESKSTKQHFAWIVNATIVLCPTEHVRELRKRTWFKLHGDLVRLHELHISGRAFRFALRSTSDELYLDADDFEILNAGEISRDQSKIGSSAVGKLLAARVYFDDDNNNAR